MNMYAKLAAAAAAVLVVGFIGYQLLPGTGGNGAQPTIAPSPTPSLLARGTFKVQNGWANVELDATGAGSDVTGRLVASGSNSNFTVDLECARTMADGLLWIGGDISESDDNENAPNGTRAAIVFKRGTPVEAVFIFQMSDPRSASCQAFFDDMLALGDPSDSLKPIEGTVQLAP